MPVSAGLQKYFDSRRGKKDDTQARLDSMANQIDPAFMDSFRDFREKILGIIDENPQEIDMIEEELDSLGTQLQHHGRVHNLKKANSIIEISERK